MWKNWICLSDLKINKNFIFDTIPIKKSSLSSSINTKIKQGFLQELGQTYHRSHPHQVDLRVLFSCDFCDNKHQQTFYHNSRTCTVFPRCGTANVFAACC